MNANQYINFAAVFAFIQLLKHLFVHLTIDLYDIASVATDAGLSLIIGNYAVTSCTDGTLPVVKTGIASNRKVYWGGFDGFNGSVSYLNDALSVIPNAGLATTFSRDGYYSTATTPALGAINIRDIVAI
jgi:hypothetical protein